LSPLRSRPQPRGAPHFLPSVNFSGAARGMIVASAHGAPASGTETNHDDRFRLAEFLAA
jgi:hypothetical protein